MAITIRHFDQELDDLKQKLLRMGAAVENQIQTSLRALVERDTELAQQVIENDLRINSLDVQVDEDSIRLLALHQPTAKDLRFITTAMKISSELERMGDLADNIAERALEFNEEPQLKPYIDIPRMAHWTMRMVQECLDAFVNSDPLWQARSAVTMILSMI